MSTKMNSLNHSFVLISDIANGFSVSAHILEDKDKIAERFSELKSIESNSPSAKPSYSLYSIPSLELDSINPSNYASDDRGSDWSKDVLYMVQNYGFFYHNNIQSVDQINECLVNYPPLEFSYGHNPIDISCFNIDVDIQHSLVDLGSNISQVEAYTTQREINDLSSLKSVLNKFKYSIHNNEFIKFNDTLKTLHSLSKESEFLSNYNFSELKEYILQHPSLSDKNKEFLLDKCQKNIKSFDYSPENSNACVFSKGDFVKFYCPNDFYLQNAINNNSLDAPFAVGVVSSVSKDSFAIDSPTGSFSFNNVDSLNFNTKFALADQTEFLNFSNAYNLLKAKIDHSLNVNPYFHSAPAIPFFENKGEFFLKQIDNKDIDNLQTLPDFKWSFVYREHSDIAGEYFILTKEGAKFAENNHIHPYKVQDSDLTKKELSVRDSLTKSLSCNSSSKDNGLSV